MFVTIYNRWLYRLKQSFRVSNIDEGARSCLSWYFKQSFLFTLTVYWTFSNKLKKHINSQHNFSSLNFKKFFWVGYRWNFVKKFCKTGIFSNWSIFDDRKVAGDLGNVSGRFSKVAPSTTSNCLFYTVSEQPVWEFIFLTGLIVSYRPSKCSFHRLTKLPPWNSSRIQGRIACTVSTVRRFVLWFSSRRRTN